MLPASEHVLGPRRTIPVPLLELPRRIGIPTREHSLISHPLNVAQRLPLAAQTRFDADAHPLEHRDSTVRPANRPPLLRATRPRLDELANLSTLFGARSMVEAWMYLSG